MQDLFSSVGKTSNSWRNLFNEGRWKSWSSLLTNLSADLAQRQLFPGTRFAVSAAVAAPVALFGGLTALSLSDAMGSSEQRPLNDIASYTPTSENNLYNTIKRKSLSQRFDYFQEALDKYGTPVGTGHDRILIPKTLLSEQDINRLGFMGVKIAIPETGQDRLESFRHPSMREHIHSHGDVWAMHEDRHKASTMMTKSWLTKHPDASLPEKVIKTAQHTVEGSPHAVTEGIPGLFYYLKNQLFGSKEDTMKYRLLRELPPEYLQQVRLTNQAINTIPGKDDAYNVIEGLFHGGMAEQKRKQITDFGSGYQRDKESKYSSLPSLAFAGIGAGIGYSAAYPWQLSRSILDRYPRLAELRQVGSKHGFRMISTSTPSFFDEKIPIKSWSDLGQQAMQRILFQELKPSSHLYNLNDFGGVAYIQSGEYFDQPLAPKMANWGNWNIGSDKIDTWNYLQNKGASGLHADSLPAERFYSRDAKNAVGITDEGRTFLQKAGGIENIVVKRRDAARGVGVWLNAAKLPSDIADHMVRNPMDYLLQQKLDLAEEFRVVTVGNKAVHSTYRFGSPLVRELADKLDLGAVAASETKIARVSPFETIQPIFNRGIKTKLESFAEEVSRHLPYDIGALDIGLTKSGEYKLIEAQRSFGNISNPIVSSRIKQLITGKAGWLGIATALAGVGLAYGAYQKISGRDDAYNTIEGLGHKGVAQQERKAMTEFGSGWDKLKALVDATYKSKIGFSEFAKSARFQKALSSAQFVGELGKGGFGKTSLYETSIKIGKQQHTFQFVRKTSLTGDALTHEAGMLNKMQHSENVPSFYGLSDDAKSLNMEFIPGRSFKTTKKSSWLDKLRQRKDLKALDRDLRSANIGHGDLGRYMGRGEWEGHNLIKTEKGRIALIDFGEAVEGHSPFARGAKDTVTLEQQRYLSLRQQEGKRFLGQWPSLQEMDRLTLSSLSSSFLGRFSSKMKEVIVTPLRNAMKDITVKTQMRRDVIQLMQSKATVATQTKMFENARSAGKRSKSTYGATAITKKG